MYMYINKTYPSVGKSSRLLSVTQEWPDSPTTEPCRCYSGKYIIMRDENGRKKEASKVKQTNKAKQHSTPKAVSNEPPRVGFEPTSTCTCCTHEWSTHTSVELRTLVLVDSLILCHEDVLLRVAVDIIEKYQKKGVFLSGRRHSPRCVGNRVLLAEGVLGKRYSGVYPNVLHLNNGSV